MIYAIIGVVLLMAGLGMWLKYYGQEEYKYNNDTFNSIWRDRVK